MALPTLYLPKIYFISIICIASPQQGDLYKLNFQISECIGSKIHYFNILDDISGGNCILFPLVCEMFP